MKSFSITKVAMLIITATFALYADGLSEKDIAKARKIYFEKCAKCHRMYEPREYSDEEWSKWINLMAKKSKLKQEQKDVLENFLKLYRERKIEIK